MSRCSMSHFNNAWMILIGAILIVLSFAGIWFAGHSAIGGIFAILLLLGFACFLEVAIDAIFYLVFIPLWKYATKRKD